MYSIRQGGGCLSMPSWDTAGTLWPDPWMHATSTLSAHYGTIKAFTNVNMDFWSKQACKRHAKVLTTSKKRCECVLTTLQTGGGVQQWRLFAAWPRLSFAFRCVDRQTSLQRQLCSEAAQTAFTRHTTLPLQAPLNFPTGSCRTQLGQATCSWQPS
jgi:hypothetical protein